MKPPQDPPRLLDPGSDAPAWLRSSLEPGARDVPSPERLARIAALLPVGPVGLEPHGSGPSETPPSPPPAAPVVAPAVPSVLASAVGGAALGLAVITAGWLASPRAAEAPPAARPAPSVAVTVAAPEPLRPAPTKPTVSRAHAASERPEAISSGAAAPAASAALAPASAPDPVVGSGPAGPGSSEGTESAAEPEGVILQRAQDALRGSPARALALTELHLARFPGGVLAQEREVIAVSALLGMGRAAEARARATRFVASFPTSAHRRRLEVLIPDLESSAGVHKDASDRPSTP